MGYLVKRSGSIATSMLAHSSANMSSLLLGGVIGLTTLGRIPVWLHFVGFDGLGSAILFAQFVGKNVSADEASVVGLGSARHIVRNTVPGR